MDTEINQASSTDNDFPVAAILCIAIGAWLFIIVLILVIRSCCVHKGWCADQWQCCGKEGEPQCCTCWINCADSCNCCGSPSLDSCLDSICPRRKKLDCSDIIMCRCCAGPDCCNDTQPLCDCGDCDCTCNCQPPECDNIDCCCFVISTQNHGPGIAGADHGGNPGYDREGGYGGPDYRGPRDHRLGYSREAGNIRNPGYGGGRMDAQRPRPAISGQHHAGDELHYSQRPGPGVGRPVAEQAQHSWGAPSSDQNQTRAGWGIPAPPNNQSQYPSQQRRY